MENKNIRITLIAIVVLHAILAMLFANATPYRQAGVLLSQRHAAAADIGAPDERQHVNYVRRLADGQGIPVFNPKDPNLYETYQSHQPPLYYGVAAAWMKVSGDHEGRSLRFLNILFGCGTVVAVFFLGRFAFSDRVGVLASAFCAMLPMFCALSGAVSNDPLLFLICTSALALIARGIRHGFTMRDAIVLGVVFGLGVWTKTTAVALLPAMIVATIATLKSTQFSAKHLAISAGVGLVMIAPWWMRNQSLYGDPLALKAFDEAFTGSAQASMFIDSIGMPGYLLNWVGWWTARSFFGIFGYMDIAMNEKGVPGATCPNTLYRLLLIGTLVAVIGYFAASKSKLKSDAVQWVNLTFGLIILLLFLKFNLHYFQAQARYLYAAIGPIAVAFAAGLLFLLKDRLKAALTVTVVILGGVSFYAINLLPDAFKLRTESSQTIAVP